MEIREELNNIVREGIDELKQKPIEKENRKIEKIEIEKNQ